MDVLCIERHGTRPEQKTDSDELEECKRASFRRLVVKAPESSFVRLAPTKERMLVYRSDRVVFSGSKKI